MAETGGEAYLELRARYLQLLAELRCSRDHNPETLEAFERILGSETVEAEMSRWPIFSIFAKQVSDNQPRQAVA